MPDELSPSEAARRVGATTRSVQRWIALNRLPARRVGGRWRVAIDALDAFMAGNAAAVAPDHARPAGGMQQQASPEGADFAGVRVGVGLGAENRIRTLFIANRGEIVRRIARTAQRLGITVVAPAADVPGALDLLDIGAVVAAAKAVNADAVHPGFGFLAENADFARAVIDARIRWVGPSPKAIRAMGDKGAARRLATDLGIPVVPGYDGEGQSDAALHTAATSIGYPILVKPAAGGGGNGMRVVTAPDRLPDALAGARREAAAAFGDDRLILERLVEGPHHVEVQVLFDGQGQGVHLGERDCSIQRRHQKILEESPSPAVSRAIRARLTHAALELASAVGYESAGTCEFLLTDRGEMFFLEMNTRLQVEHPVTELVTGLDLVEAQLRIAAGEPLEIDQAAIDQALGAGGHAIEVRLYAEDAEAGFLPATGRVERLAWPTGEGIRVDAGIDEGSIVGDRFDPMLAKIVAHGSNRDEALSRLTTALDDTTVLGFTTNLRFLRWLVRQPVVEAGDARIDTLDRIWPPDVWAERATIPAAVWQVAAQALAVDGSRDGWRLNAARTIRLEADDEGRVVAIQAVGKAGAGAEAAPAFIRRDDTVHLDVAGRSVEFRLAPPPDVDRAARAATQGTQAGTAELVAPMPGAVITVHRSAGERVEAGDAIVTLEAMKMEHAVLAPVDGTVTEIDVRVGDQVARRQVLAVVEP
ncbi:MAG TPA: biotin carboxylase N-terminal domain-containing protein [Candidatus Limnocylindrales bacterium]|nr:biotin carboxylase N-terminal domain-containing protein [Candidatus Limnocylindrales bacterium]